MMEKSEGIQQQLEQNQQEEPMSHVSRVVMIGLFGGLFWSLLGYIAYIFNFTEMGPALILEPWIDAEWKNSPLGNFIGIAIISLASILIALLYNAMFSKFDKLWIGITFGLALWGLVFYLLNPIFPNLKPVTELDPNTIITTICLYILYGVFIGYSISYDAVEMKKLKEQQLAYSNE